MPERTTPLSAHNFRIDLRSDGVDPDSVLGGFSDVSGIGNEFEVAEYRNGNEKENHVRKIPGIHKVSDITLKRGLVSSKDMWKWIKDVRTQGPEMKRDVTITLRDESGKTQQTWTLKGVIPMKYTAPTLAAKGGGEVAMEELVLSVEGLDSVEPG